MKIDKSKLTDAERAFLDSIEKRYGTEDQPAGGTPVVAPTTEVPAAPTVEKAAPQAETPAQTQTQVPEQQTGDEGIYKGLHPAVKGELEELKKFREATEERELSQVAKKYEIIGKKPEELVPLFKSLKAAGGTAYSDMIAVLDQAVETVEKSGAFSEIGKSGHGSNAAGAVEAKVDAIAKGYMEKDSSLDYTAAMAKAWEDHPDRQILFLPSVCSSAPALPLPAFQQYRRFSLFPLPSCTSLLILHMSRLQGMRLCPIPQQPVMTCYKNLAVFQIVRFIICLQPLYKHWRIVQHDNLPIQRYAVCNRCCHFQPFSAIRA